MITLTPCVDPSTINGVVFCAGANMPRKKSSTPTEAELEILNILWDCGSATVRDVHTQLLNKTNIGYTTVLKTMQIMHDKQMVLRNEDERAHIYRPVNSKDRVQKKIVKDMLQRAFSGSIPEMVMSVLGHKKPTVQDIEEIKRYLDNVENK